MSSEVFIPADVGFEPTQEQLDIVKAAISEDRLKIDAMAGSAKTTTLSLIAENIDKPSLYLAFNKKMAEEASGRFPPHVEVRTTHSLAYQRVGHAYKHKLSRPYGEYKNVLGTGGEIARAFNIAPMPVTPTKYITSAAMGQAVKQTVNNFEFSKDRAISENHVSMHEARAYLSTSTFDKAKYKARVFRFAKKLWEKRIDLNDSTIITHDTYMKLFQLSNPSLEGFEVIYVDEAQDSNPCLLDIILKQKHGKIFLVGDQYQAIYQFRKSVNGMQTVPWKSLKLTKSFRFGSEVADLAYNILLDEDMNPCATIEGWEQKTTKVLDQLPKDHEGLVHIICRTNSELLTRAMELIQEGKRVNIEVDVKDFVSKIDSAVALYNGDMKKVKHVDFISYTSWNDLVEEGKLMQGEIARIAKIVSSNAYHEILKLIRDYKPSNDPEFILVTCHKFKGQEADTVVLEEDFEPTYEDELGETKYINDAERNLLYVAITRAKEMLVINNKVREILSLRNSDHEEILNDQVSQYPGLKLNVGIISDSPLKLAEYLDTTDNAIEAQNQLDMHGDSGYYDEEGVDLSRNVDGSLRLMPSLDFSIFKES